MVGWWVLLYTLDCFAVYPPPQTLLNLMMGKTLIAILRKCVRIHLGEMNLGKSAF